MTRRRVRLWVILLRSGRRDSLRSRARPRQRPQVNPIQLDASTESPWNLKLLRCERPGTPAQDPTVRTSLRPIFLLYCRLRLSAILRARLLSQAG